MLYINKHQKVSWVELADYFKISKADAREIVSALKEQEYISYIGDTKFVPTIKGKTFLKSFILNWLFNNVLAIIAIIISIIALFK